MGTNGESPGGVTRGAPKPRGINSYHAFLTTLARDVPKQLQRSRKARAAIHRGGR